MTSGETGNGSTAQPPSVVAFWREAGPQQWFTRSADFDARFKDRFMHEHFAAAGRQLDHWSEVAEGSLALLILLDQFPRNAFRGSAHMYATDPLARHFARQAVAAGHDRIVEPELRLFFYLPFEHSEQIVDQELSIELHRLLGDGGDRYASGHFDIIKRFGRFPHRNAMLGRETTPEEAAFLKGGGFAG